MIQNNRDMGDDNIPSNVAGVWASGPQIDIVPLSTQPQDSNPANWPKVGEAKSTAKVNVLSSETSGASVFSFDAFFPDGAGQQMIWGFGCLYQGQCLGVIRNDNPIWLGRKFHLSVRGQAQPVRQ